MKDCRNHKAQVNHKRKAAQTNIIEVEKHSKNASNISFSTIVSEVNLVGKYQEMVGGHRGHQTHVRIRRCSFHMHVYRSVVIRVSGCPRVYSY